MSPMSTTAARSSVGEGYIGSGQNKESAKESYAANDPSNGIYTHKYTHTYISYVRWCGCLMDLKSKCKSYKI